VFVRCDTGGMTGRVLTGVRFGVVIGLVVMCLTACEIGVYDRPAITDGAGTTEPVSVPSSAPTASEPSSAPGATVPPPTVPSATPEPTVPATTTGVLGQTYALVWHDEFDGTGVLDPARWTYQTGAGGWGNQELQYYTGGANATVAGGVLTITARREAVGGAAYTSARVVTEGLAAWRYGVVEVRAKVPRGVGTWPAIWMMPAGAVYGQWPLSGEIDIMEHVGFDQDTIVAAVHTGAYNGMAGTQKTASVVVPGASDDFHTYGLEWAPDRITVSVDGQPYFTYDKPPGATTQEWPFDQDFYLIMNVAVGGTWGGAHGVDDSAFPAGLVVDYVRVYRTAGG